VEGVVSETPDDGSSSAPEVTQKERQQHVAVKLAVRLLWRGGHRVRVVRRVAGSLDWAGYCTEIDALRMQLHAEYSRAVERGEIGRVDSEPDFDAALLMALHYFHAKETPPLPLPPAMTESTSDLLRYFAQLALAGRWQLEPPRPQGSG
jgi:hypothetical protein